MPWTDLTRTALLGTEHSSLPESSLQKLQAEGLDIAQDQSLLLAEAAALFSPIRKAGFSLKKFAGKMPEALNKEEEATCSLRSTEHLRLILDGQYAPALSEFMAHLLMHGLCLPTEHLPALLQRPDLNEWWHLVEPALGLRGAWLLRQHPQWKNLVEKPDLEYWNTGKREERLRLLRSLRQQAPKEAIDLLESTWESENHRDKAAFLGELSTGLSANSDEVFLEKCLTDRRKEVRKKAAGLLTMLPDSAFGERMFERAKSCLIWSRGKLEVILPEEPDKAAIADGILKIHLEWKGGAKAGYLGQVISVVPPSLWELSWDLPRETILKKFKKTDWSATLLLALATATVRYEDAAWTELLLQFWFDEEDSPLWTETIGGQLLESATPETVHRLAMNFLNENSGLPGEDTPLFQLFLQNEGLWENELTMLLIERFRNWLRQTKKPDWTSFHFKELLKMLSYRCDADLYEKLQSGWDSRLPLWAFWERPVQEMLEIVLFRKEMKLEMERV